MLGSYADSSLKKRFLKKGAIPSVFSIPATSPGTEKEQKIHEIPARKRLFASESDNNVISPLNTASSSFFDSGEEAEAPSCKVFKSAMSPSTKIKKLEFLAKKKNKKIKQLQRKALRKEKTITGLLTQLNKQKFLSKELGEKLDQNFGHLKLYKNELKNRDRKAGSRYNQEMKEFAVSLHFYSAKAYNFVRKSLHLPHPATIRSWAADVACEPGFLMTTISSLAGKAALDGESECGLIVDEMSIRSETLWDRKNSKFVGNVDYGKTEGEDPQNIAKNVLVIMAAGLKKPWQIPIGYFLTNKTTSEVQSELILEAIKLLFNKAEMIVKSVTFDGPTKNISTAKKLGCDIENLKGSFPHPCRPDLKVYVILDICHMIKLARNALGDLKMFKTPTGENISWAYVEALYEIQQQDILNIANKLKTKHIQWHKHKMKVSVAAQTLSASVAAAITFLRNIQVKNFMGSKATSDFILLMNNLFDILNSKSKFGKQYKAPINLENYANIEKYLQDGIKFLKTIKTLDGVAVVNGPRKTFIQGFAISADSILAISKELLQRASMPYKYVLTYRFSQDALEMFFSKIRSRLGWNNNPNALQFKYALRSLLLRNNIECPTTANCVPTAKEQSDLPDQSDQQFQDTQISEMLQTSNVWRYDVLFYISGYIAKKLLKNIKCPECAEALYQPADVAHDHQYHHSITLLSCKCYGKLLVPSLSVVKVVMTTDTIARQVLSSWSPLNKEKKEKIYTDVLKETKLQTFQDLFQHSQQCHVLDGNLRDDHITILIMHIAKLYLQLFLYQFGKVYTERIVKENKASKRHVLTKQILFYNE